MKYAELVNQSREDLHKKMLELLRDQFNLRVQKAAQQLKQTHLIKKNRKTIARIKFLLGNKMSAEI